MRLLIATNAPTFKEHGKFSAYAPYVKEMDIWFSFVKEVGILSPGTYPDPVYTSEFNIQNIRFFKVQFLKFSTILETIKVLFVSPYVIIQIIRSFIWADHIHLRCPGNIGLLACFVQILFPGKPKTAKYAGNWDPRAKQPWSYKLQKWILSNTFLTRNITVLTYGNWPDQSRNIRPFFTASFSEKEKEKILKDFSVAYKFLFVGSLVSGKQPQIAFEVVERLQKNNINIELHVYGDGPLKYDLEIRAEKNEKIYLHGNQPLEIIKKAYKEAHFLILTSKSEGWPKAIAEAMFFGCIPIAIGVSCVPWMLGGGSRGILISEEQAFNWNRGESGERKEDSQHVLDNMVKKVIELIKNPVEMKRMSIEAQEWSQKFTLERFEKAIQNVLAPSH